jgi:hypothetical protein
MVDSTADDWASKKAALKERMTVFCLVEKKVV